MFIDKVSILKVSFWVAIPIIILSAVILYSGSVQRTNAETNELRLETLSNEFELPQDEIIYQHSQWFSSVYDVTVDGAQYKVEFSEDNTSIDKKIKVD